MPIRKAISPRLQPAMLPKRWMIRAIDRIYDQVAKPGRHDIHPEGKAELHLRAQLEREHAQVHLKIPAEVREHPVS